MALRFFADHCVSNAITLAVARAGHGIFRLRDQLPADSADAAVLARAQELDAILLSLNSDFADIVTYPPAQFKGIVALQLHNHPEIEPALIRRLEDFLSLHPAMDQYRGKVIVVEVDRIRVRQ